MDDASDEHVLLAILVEDHVVGQEEAADTVLDPGSELATERVRRERAVWDRDVARWKDDFGALERFFLAVANGRAGTEQEETARGFRFISTDSIPQGAFYTVGWMLRATIGRGLGRPALVAVICDRPAMLRAWNRAASAVNRRDPPRGYRCGATSCYEWSALPAPRPASKVSS